MQEMQSLPEFSGPLDSSHAVGFASNFHALSGELYVPEDLHSTEPPEIYEDHHKLSQICFETSQIHNPEWTKIDRSEVCKDTVLPAKKYKQSTKWHAVRQFQ
eukprot:979432_1